MEFRALGVLEVHELRSVVFEFQTEALDLNLRTIAEEEADVRIRYDTVKLYVE